MSRIKGWKRYTKSRKDSDELDRWISAKYENLLYIEEVRVGNIPPLYHGSPEVFYNVGLVSHNQNEIIYEDAEGKNMLLK